MIGIVDSGLGGLSVLRELKKKAPDVDIVYFGDIKRSPYGNRTTAELGALIALGFSVLKNHGANKIITACNSVSVHLMDSMFDILDIPKTDVIEMLEPTVTYCHDKGYSKVLMLATEATIRSEMYQHNFHTIGINCDTIALKGLVTLIDTGASSKKVRELITTYKGEIDCRKYDAIILGCTHFPLVTSIFKEVLGDTVVYVDPALPVSEKAVALFGTKGNGTLHFLLSEESSVFRQKIQDLFPEVEYDVKIVS